LQRSIFIANLKCPASSLQNVKEYPNFKIGCDFGWSLVVIDNVAVRMNAYGFLFTVIDARSVESRKFVLPL